ncbi:dCTP deaminase domain-containing protein [Nocardia goodfellowii]|uniref:Deoxycytidine triphosphate deaminase n=2 Tax=Nocardia goodfellowii TaxID=882446 RepID=A0ABS4QLA2_9NOCA|nr:deoxycytidine triphosphate deaminase [Nocardia goodfellowii]
MATNSRGEQRSAHPGILPEREVKKLCDTNLITRSNNTPVITRQTTVELHASEIAWFGTRSPVERRHVTTDGKITINSGDIVSLVTLECLAFPGDLCATIFPRGRLLALGLWSSATHVDFSFRGHLRIIFINLGPHTLTIPVGEPIGRLEITRLGETGTSGYLGVNSDLRNANNQSDYLVAGTNSTALTAQNGTLTLWSFAERLAQTELRQEVILKSMRRRRKFFTVGVVLILIGLLGLLGWASWKLISQFLDSKFGASFGASFLMIFASALVAYLANRYRPSLVSWVNLQEAEVESKS